MYYQHFGFDGPPFRLMSSATNVYLSDSHRECLAAMEWALLHENCGFMVLVGETGTGKTTLLNATVARRLPNLHLAFVTNPKLSFEEIMLVVLPQLGVSAIDRGRLTLIQALESALASQPEGHRTAIVIDEAQDLSDETLEDLRLLTNSVGLNENEIQFILMGQPELIEHLSAPHLRQFRERIGAKATLKPLDGNESIDYVNFRLRAVNGAPGIFNGKALRYIVDASAGIPRRLNVLCHNALLQAFSKGATTVSLGDAREVVADYEGIFRPLVLAKEAEVPQNDVESPSSDSEPVLEDAIPSFRLEVPSKRSSYKSFAIAAVLATFVLGAGSLLATMPGSWRDLMPSASQSAGPKLASIATNSSGTAAAAQIPSSIPLASAPATTAEFVVPAAATNPSSASMISPRRRSISERAQIRIRAGDTLHDLAQKYLGSTDRTRALIAANPQITDPEHLLVGDIIYLPSNTKLSDSGVTR